MKQLFMALSCAVLTLTTVACNNEEDIPAPISGTQSSIEASFPKGAEVMDLKINVPDLVRTRAEGDGLDFWGAFNNDTQDIKIRYAVYTTDGNLFYSSDSAESELSTKLPSFSIKVPMPADDSNANLFVWADKLGKDGDNSYQGYPINWEEHTVSMPAVINTGALTNMSKLGDAWCCYESITPSTTSITLKRKMSQIILATDEFELPAIADKFGHARTEATYWFCKDGEDCTTAENGYRVSSWNFVTGEIKFAKNQFAYFSTIPMENATLYVNNRQVYPLMAAYYFCDGERMVDGNFNTQHMLNGLNHLRLSVKNADGYQKTFDVGINYDPNMRWIIMPKKVSEGAGGIFTNGHGEIQSTLDLNWSYTNTGATLR